MERQREAKRGMHTYTQTERERGGEREGRQRKTERKKPKW